MRFFFITLSIILLSINSLFSLTITIPNDTSKNKTQSSKIEILNKKVETGKTTDSSPDDKVQEETEGITDSEPSENSDDNSIQQDEENQEITSPDEKTSNTIIQLILDTGFGIQGLVSDQNGIEDYQIFFIRPAFHINEFGFGLDINFRFRMFPSAFEFKATDWTNQENALMGFYIYSDKIDYIKYGSKNHFIFFNTGDIGFKNFGTGLLINNFHNRAFTPTNRENGIEFNFYGRNLKNPLPIHFFFAMPDMVDPDIILYGFDIDILDFTIHDDMNLLLGIGGAFDLNTTESNRLSATNYNDITYHRNSVFDTMLTGFTIPVIYTLDKQFYEINIYNELSMLLLPNDDNFSTFRFGLTDKIGTLIKTANIKNSGYLFGGLTSLIIRYGDHTPNYFSSNYQSVRNLQYQGHSESYEIYIETGFELYALNESVKFHYSMIMPLTVDTFSTNFKSSFVYEAKKDDIIPGLIIGAYYQSSISDLNISGDGGYFLESITKNFRFSVEAGYKIFGAKIMLIAGVQRGAWVKAENYTEYRDDILTGNLITDDYGADLDKFFALEVSFVL